MLGLVGLGIGYSILWLRQPTHMLAKRSAIAAKSIGVVYVESANRLLITLGYRDDAPPYAIRLHCVPLGKIDAMAHDFTLVEKKLSEAGSQYDNIVCHELYVTKDKDFFLVLMTHEA